MSHLRALVRMTALGIVIAATALALALAGLLGVPSPAAGERVRERIGTLCARTLSWICGLRITVAGRAPKAPFLLVANHLGYIDILLVRSVVPTRFVSKAEIARWPLIGRLARLAGTLFLERRNNRDLSRLNTAIEEEMDAGFGVTVFPEGTSGPGARVLPFHAGLLAFAAATAVPVHAASLHYSTGGEPDPAHAICWWGDMTFLDHLYNLLRMPGFEGRITFDPLPVVVRDRKQLANALQRKVNQLFEPIDGAPPA